MQRMSRDAIIVLCTQVDLLSELIIDVSIKQLVKNAAWTTIRCVEASNLDDAETIITKAMGVIVYQCRQEGLPVHALVAWLNMEESKAILSRVAKTQGINLQRVGTEINSLLVMNDSKINVPGIGVA